MKQYEGLCQDGALLIQRLEIGVTNLQESTMDLKKACSDIATTLVEVQNTTTSIHTRLSAVEREAAKSECQIFELKKNMDGHMGEHRGSERAGEIAGKKYGIIYGLTGALTGSIGAIFAIYRMAIG